MKNKNNKTRSQIHPNHRHKPIHLHVEHFFRKQYCLLAVMSLMLLAVVKSDGHLFTMMRDAYAHGFGLVGQYMREETSRTAENVTIAPRVASISSK
jgi:hypothetical protein